MNEIAKLPWVYRSIDFTQCRHYDDFYLMVKRELEIPDICGHNLDALYDGVTGMMQLPADITVRGISELPHDCQHLAARIVEVFRKAEKKYGLVRVHITD